VGPAEDGSTVHYEAEMILRWGPDWKAGAAAGLTRWAAPFATVDTAGIEALMAVRHMSHYDKLTDLQRMLTLIPPREQHEWCECTRMMAFETEIAHCHYATTARSLAHARYASDGDPGDGLALAFTDTGTGVSDRDTTTWIQTPVPSPVLTYEDALCAEIIHRSAAG